LHDPASTCRSCSEPRNRFAAAVTPGDTSSGSATLAGRALIRRASVRNRMIDIYVNR